MIIAVDFDGTCVTHEFPKVGKDIGAVPILKELVEKGHKIILYTMRSHPDKNSQGKTLSGEIVSNDTLQDAIDWFKKNGIPLWGINENPKQKEWTSSPKIYAIVSDVVRLKYDLEFKDFFIPLQECIDRDSKKPNPIGEDAIRKIYERYKNILKV